MSLIIQTMRLGRIQEPAAHEPRLTAPLWMLIMLKRGSPTDSIAFSIDQSMSPRHAWARTLISPTRDDEMSVKINEALAPRPQHHLLMMSARVSLTPTFSCRASSNCERSEHPGSPVCCNVR